jgi:hypothetical protein
MVKSESQSGVEAKCGRLAKDLWSAGDLAPLFPSFPSTIFLFVSTTAPWGQIREIWPHGLPARPPTLAGRPHLGSPIKVLPRGASSFIP